MMQINTRYTRDVLLVPLVSLADSFAMCGRRFAWFMRFIGTVSPTMRGPIGG